MFHATGRSGQADRAKIIQTNGYWAHGENILVAMLADKEHEIRARAVDIIMQCRQRPCDEIRQFRPPQINFNADNYTLLSQMSCQSVSPL